jgi:hypothetical protein
VGFIQVAVSEVIVTTAGVLFVDKILTKRCKLEITDEDR